jgi:hypothetical protein
MRKKASFEMSRRVLTPHALARSINDASDSRTAGENEHAEKCITNTLESDAETRRETFSAASNNASPSNSPRHEKKTTDPPA